jgi:protein PhnA
MLNLYLKTYITMDEITVKDSNGNILKEGDSVTIIKDLKVKGSSTVLKRGTVVKGIRLTDNASEIEGRVNKEMMVIRTEFLKKA